MENRERVKRTYKGVLPFAQEFVCAAHANSMMYKKPHRMEDNHAEVRNAL